MKNMERKDNVEALSELYFPYMVVELLKKMPTEQSDPDGALFEEFMNTLQTAKSAVSDTTLNKSDKANLEAKLKLSARKFGLSKDIIINVEK